ncbi:MAG TPA: enoyl-CoA hydratase-related protein [bacterium]|nr:enoyl-CoA hydratase-related protein [bacterium]
MQSEVLYEQRGDIVVVTLNRPERRNALSISACHQLRAAWDRFEADGASKVAIITGAGDRAFCAGYDIAEKQHGNAVSEADFAPRVETRPFVTKPVIAAVNGAAVAAGMALVEACDLVVAAETAWFGLPEVTLGIGVAPFVQSLWTLPQHILMELLLTGDRLAAPRAYEIGFVNRLTPPENLMAESLRLARTIADNAPLVVRASKAMLYRGIEAIGMPAAHRVAKELFLPIRESEDAKEGFRARAERRPPRWKGR